MKTVNSISSLLNQYGVEIPLIQRDYVQGRIHEANDKTSDELKDKFKEEKDKRDGFVRELLEALRSGNPKKLTFIYGVLRDNDKPGCHEKAFLPIDGQQRLTTLFLLCWMLAHCFSVQRKTDMKSLLSTDFLNGFRSFRYKTRPSSNLFCERLIDEDFIPAGKDTISENIKLQPWFGDGWVKDPSVQAMLQMLDEIEIQLNKTPFCWGKMFDNLFIKDVISFECLDMDTYRLTDELYVKMNARGKQLTPFEIFKARFTKVLKDKYPFAKYDDTHTLQGYFNDAIEHQWTNLFWRYCKKDIDAYNKYKEALESGQNDSQMDKGKEYAVIDEYFMNFFNAMAQVLYHITYPEEKRVDDIKAREVLTTDTSGDNIRLIFHFLDKLCEIKNKNDVLWDELFYLSKVDFMKADHKVRLFQDSNKNVSVNLLDRCVVQGAKNMDILLLYALLKWDNTVYSDDFAFYMRHIRNWLIKKAMHTRNDTVQIDEDLELSKLDELNSEIERIKANIIVPSIEQEIVEDIDYVRGNLIPGILKWHNYDSALKNAFELFDGLKDDEKRKVLIANGFTGIQTKDCSHGKCRFFGNRDQTSDRFHFIFMRNAKDEVDTISGPFHSFIYRVSRGESPQDQIKNTLDSKSKNKEYDFVYYVLKYKSFLEVKAKSKKSLYYLSVNGDIDKLDIIGLGNYSQSPMRSYHADPFAYTIAQNLISNIPVEGAKSYYVAYSTTGSYPADLWIYDSPNTPKPILTVHHNRANNSMEFIDANDFCVPLPTNLSQDLIEQAIDEIQNRLSPCTFKE